MLFEVPTLYDAGRLRIDGSTVSCRLAVWSTTWTAARSCVRAPACSPPGQTARLQPFAEKARRRQVPGDVLGEGEPLLVMDRGTPVARILPAADPGGGLITRPPTRDLQAVRKLLKRLPPLDLPVDSLSILLEDRRR